MLIQAISSDTSSLTVLNPVSTAKSTTTSSTDSTTASDSTQATTSTTTASTTTSTTTSSSSSSSSGGGGGGSSSSAAEEIEAATSFSMTVDGKQYSGSVEESDGEYTASIAGLAGATATGSSATTAENNLTTRISEIV